MFPSKKTQYYRIISVHELEWEPRCEHAAARNFHALSFRIKGNAEFICDKKSLSVATGDIAFVPKGQSYTLDEKTSAHLFVVHFESLPDKPQDLEVFKLSGIPWYEEHFKKLHRIWQRKETGYRLSATSVFYRILEEIEKESVKERLHTKNRLMSVVDYIHSSYTDPNLSVSLLSEMYGASPTYFRKIFKANYNTTPIEYITNLRLKRAEELLKSGYYSVSGAAFESGFSDPKYFSRIFKSEKGISPSKLLSTKK